MSSSSSSSSSMVITREEFNTFHKIDRSLFSRLIFGLNQDINLSFQVMGFLLLLEQSFGNSGDRRVRNLVAYLEKLPDSFINTLINEINLCLSCIYYQDFATTFFVSNNNDAITIPLLFNLTKGNLTLKFIHQNRENFLSDLTYNLNHICSKALNDIKLKAEGYRQKMILPLEKEISMEEVVIKNMSTLSVQQETNPKPQEGLKKSEDHVEEVVAADDRTVFLTFSKGYPIPEREVESFFKRRFGEELIEAIEMQEVEGKEQPLYAKMVLRCASKIEEIVSVKGKNKFTIDGKHVCARKYVSKNPSFSSSSSVSS